MNRMTKNNKYKKCKTEIVFLPNGEIKSMLITGHSLDNEVCIKCGLIAKGLSQYITTKNGISIPKYEK